MQRTGYTFVGWRDTNGTIWGASQLVTWSTAVNGIVDLTAVWNRNAPQFVNVHFHGNGGQPSLHTMIVTRGTAVGNLPTPIWLGQHFTGWFTAQTGGTQINASRIIHNDNESFFARWTPATMTLNPAGNWNVPTSAAASRTVQVNTNVPPWNVSGIHALGMGMDIEDIDIDISSTNQAIPNWVTITNPTGGNGASFTIHVTENTTPNARSATFNVTAGNTGTQQSGMISALSGGAVPITITVTQPAARASLQDANLGQGDAYLFRLRNLNAQNRPLMRVEGGFIRQYRGAVDTTRATDLWAIEPVPGAAGFYTIETLGHRHADRHSRNMLTGGGTSTSTTAVVSLSAHNNAQNQHWRIQRSGVGRYYITNRANPHLMLRAGSGNVVDLANSSANAGWTLERYNLETFYAGRYQRSISSGPVSLNIGVTDSALATGPLEMASIFRHGEVWGDISDNVDVRVFWSGVNHPFIPCPYIQGHFNANPQWPGAFQYTFDVVVRGRIFLGDGLLHGASGTFRPDGLERLDSWAVSSNWEFGTIYICVSDHEDGLPSRDIIIRQGVFIHEVGHALKLSHPNGEPSDPIDWHPVANMLNGSDIANNRPSGYDRFNLMRKWGR